MTALHWSLRQGDLKLSQLLVYYGMSPLDCDNQGNTGMHHAAISGNREIIEFLMTFGVDFAQKNNAEQMPKDLA